MRGFENQPAVCRPFLPAHLISLAYLADASAGGSWRWLLENWTKIDRDYETLRLDMQTLFNDLGISTKTAAA